MYGSLSNFHCSNAMIQMPSFFRTNYFQTYHYPMHMGAPVEEKMQEGEEEEEKALDLSIKRGRESAALSLPSSSVGFTTTSYSSTVYSFLPYNFDQDLSCPLCKKPFRFEKNLLRHLQKTHAAGNEESILKCKLCSYTTRHYSNMYVHIRTHTGE